MLILLRQSRVRGNRVVSERDTELRSGKIRVGSDGDCDLLLYGNDVAPEHATIKPLSGGRLQIDCEKGHTVSVNGQSESKVIIGSGQTARIGKHEIAALPAPTGFEAALEVRIDADITPSSHQRMGDNLRLKLPGRRAWSYLLGLVVLIVALGLPLLSFYEPEAAEALAENNLPTDSLWSSGPLADAHHLPGIANDCNACHAVPFQRVTNQACMECHDQTAGHFATGHPITASFNDRCTSCHLEHNEPSSLVKRDDALCVDCHTDSHERMLDAALPVDGLKVSMAPDTLRAVTGFATGEHPQFMAAFLRHDDEQGWQVHRKLLDSQNATETSNLKFPHDLHMDFEKVSWADSGADEDRVLGCNDCHTLEREGEHFRPVNMENSCANCHTLAFDDAQPDRQLPHGEPENLRTHLEEYFVRQAAIQKGQRPASKARKVPNQALNIRCSGDVLDCGKRWADQEMDKLFTKAGCVSCHEVSRGEAEWTVKPVRLAYDWYPAARFDHVPHLVGSMNGEDGDRCSGCHAAGQSSDATDVLMPGLDNCTTCHASTVESGVPLQCLDCHSFHEAGRPLMSE